MPEEEKRDEEKDKCPLSSEAWSWITLLSNEITKVEMKLTTYWNAGLIITIALLGVAVAALVASLQSEVTLVEGISKILAVALIICWIVIMIIYETRYRSPYQKILKELINTRETIISGELTDCNEIHGKWKDYIRRYYGKLLENTETNEAKKELNERKENSKKMDLKESIGEQKEVLQVSQNDIQDIKRRLQEIRVIQEGTSQFSTWCVLGGVGIAAGFGIMGISVSFSSLSLKIGGLILGLVMFLAGMSMIKSAYYAWTDLNKYPARFGSYYMKHPSELKHTNIWLFRSFLLLVFDICILIVLCIISL